MYFKIFIYNEHTKNETSHVSQGTSQEGTTEQEQGIEPESDAAGEITTNLHDVRLMLLDKLMQFIPNLSNVPGVRAIPFMQVILMLTSDLDGQDERDKTCFANLLNLFVKELNMETPDVADICARTNKREVHLVIMRLLSKFKFWFIYTTTLIIKSENIYY